MPSALSFLDRFSSFLSENIESSGSKRYLLAVSGGVDSMVMLYLFLKSGLPFEVAHCNFQLRGEASDHDEAFVRSTCEDLGIVCYSKSFDTAGYAERCGISTQMAARELRYAWFNELLAERGYDFLCTAHHRDDHAETVIFNLTKGTGIAGLHGIRPLKDQFLRPLMPFTRQEILAYAKAEGIKWREDASNASNKYSRNLIRNEVIPLLRKINPSVEQSIWKSSERVRQIEDWLAEEISKWRQKLQRSKNEVVYISLKPLQDYQHRALILTELIRPFGFSYADIEQIINPELHRVGRQFQSQEYDLVCDRDQLVISRREETGQDRLVINGPGEYVFNERKFKVEIFDKADWQLDRSKEVLQADADKIEWPLVLRPWRQGDSMQPLGMKGRKKVSDILIDEKMPLNLKKRQLVLEDENDVLWLIGLKVSEQSKIETFSKTITIISVERLK